MYEIGGIVMAKYTKRISRSDLMRIVANNTTASRDIVSEVYKAIEEALFEQVASADKNNDVEVKLFDGVTVRATYCPQKDKLNNLTGDVIKTVSRIRPKITFTRSYCDKLILRN